MNNHYIIELLKIQKDLDVRIHKLGSMGIEPIPVPNPDALFLALDFIGVFKKEDTFYQEFLYNLFRIKVVAESNYKGFIKAAKASFKKSLKDKMESKVLSNKVRMQNEDWWHQL